MKRLAWLVVLLFGSFSFGQSLRALSESQLLTRADPGASDIVDTKSLNLGNVQGFRVSVCAESGATLTGGTVKAWLYNVSTGLWQRNPALDLTVTNVGVRCRVFPDQRVVAPLGARVLYANSAVTASAGTTAVVRIDAWTNQ